MQCRDSASKPLPITISYETLIKPSIIIYYTSFTPSLTSALYTESKNCNRPNKPKFQGTQLSSFLQAFCFHTLVPGLPTNNHSRHARPCKRQNPPFASTQRETPIRYLETVHPLPAALDHAPCPRRPTRPHRGRPHVAGCDWAHSRPRLHCYSCFSFDFREMAWSG
jgi:hypothetical protein